MIPNLLKTTFALRFSTFLYYTRPGDERGVAHDEGGNEHEADERRVHHEPQRVAKGLGRHLWLRLGLELARGRVGVRVRVRVRVRVHSYRRAGRG